jgi:hypothetical protein
LKQLETTTKNGNKVLAHTILKEFTISIDELSKYAQKIHLKIKSPQDILLLDDANNLLLYIQHEQQKLNFNSDEWQSCSNIDDYQNLIQFIDHTLSAIDIQIEKNRDILKNSNSAYRALQQLNMTNEALLEIKIYLLSKFDFSLENLKEKLIVMKSEALEFLDEVTNSHSIWNDEKLSHKEINFFFTATKIVKLYEDQLEKITNFSKIDKFFKTLLKEVEALQKADERFTSTDKEKLKKHLEEGYLEIYTETLYEEWKSEIEKINQFYVRSIEAHFISTLSEETLLEVFKVLQSLKDALEDFYLTIRSGFITKYQENPKSAMLQEIVTKDRIFKIYQNAQPKLIAQLKKEESLVAYRFINRLLGELLEFRIEEKSQGYEEITEKMVALHSKNLEIYLYDVEMYGKVLEKRDMEISKLMFKMQTDLEKRGV